MLETVMHWHSDKAIYDKECAYYPGFVTKFKAAQPTDTSQDHVDYENYRHVCHKWHYKITRALLRCLESGDYIQIRNSLLVLTKIVPHFPIITNLGQALEKRIDNIRTDEKDKRPDIYALATGYSGILKNKKSSLIPENEFHLKEVRPNVSTGQSKNEVSVKVEKREVENASHKSENIKSMKSDSKSDAKSTTPKSSSLDKQAVSASGLQSSNKGRPAHKEAELNGVDSNRSKITTRIKEERGSSDSGSPLRKEDRVANSIGEKIIKEEKRERRTEDHHDKPSSRAEKENDSHVQRRSNDSSDGDREHKRRRTDPAVSKSSERENRNSSDKGKDDEKNGKQSSNDSEKAKPKEAKSKGVRKRDYSEDSSSEPRRRRAKTEEETEKQRREEKSPSLYTGSAQERRADREEKRHHRSNSVTKKRI